MMREKDLKRARDGSHGGRYSEAPAKRRRHLSEGHLQLSKLYEDLAAEQDEVRLEAAKQIVTKFSPQSHPNAKEVEQALDRLIRGLCTQRKSARFGFCVALTELLRQIFGQSQSSIEGLNLDVYALILTIENKTKVQGNVAGVERRDHLIGRLFGYKAVMQSSIVIEPELSLKCWTKLLDQIYEMARDVPWLREECCLILVDAIKTLGSKSASQECAQELIQRLVSSKLVDTPQGVAIWLTVRAAYPDVLPTDAWRHNDPLSKKERTRLAKIMKEDFRSASGAGSDEAIKSAGANPNPVFAWNLVLSEALQRDMNKKDDHTDADKSVFSQLWLDTVDSHLFALSASHERKSWGFKLFKAMVDRVPDWAIAALFSPNFMRTLLNQTVKADRFLHKAALQAWKAIQLRAEHSPGSTSALFIALTSRNGSADFGTKKSLETLEHIVLSSDDGSLRKIVRHMKALILRPETSEQETADQRRRRFADLLLSIVRHDKRYEDLGSNFVEQDNWLRNILELLVECAYFVPSQSAKTSKVPLPPISDSNRKMFQERVSSCLTRLLKLKDLSRTSIATMVLGMIRSKATSKALDPIFKADEPVLKTVKRAFRTLDTLSSESSTAPATEGLILLYSLTLLQVYNGDGDALLMLEDLESSRDALLKTTKDTATHGQEAFVEIVLSFLGNSRTLFREIAEDAFAAFVANISPEGLRSLTDILDTEETLEGQRELFAQDEEDAHSANSSSDTEEASDVEMLDGEGKGADESGPESDEESSSEAESGANDGTGSDAEEEDEELVHFNNMLSIALQTSNPALNGNASESSEESDMDDEQMMALDPHLSKIFQQRQQTPRKKTREDAKQNMIQFKNRVLDLLAIFFEKEPSSPLALEALLPLLRRTRSKANQQLAERSMKLLRSYFDMHAKHKASLPTPTDVDPVWQVLQAIHEEGKLGDGGNLHVSSCSVASLHVVKVLVALDRTNYSRVVDIYAQTQKDWYLGGKTGVRPNFITQLMNWSAQTKTYEEE